MEVQVWGCKISKVLAYGWMFSKKTSVSWNDGMVLKNAKFWLLTSDFEMFSVKKNTTDFEMFQ